MSNPGPITPRRARPVLHGPAYTSPQYHSRVWGPLIFLGLTLLLVGIIVVGGGLYWELHRSQGSSTQNVTFKVSAGDTVTTVATRLKSRGYIDNSLFFRLDGRMQGLAAKLKSGDCTIRPNMSIDGMVSALSSCHAPTVVITVPEGQRTGQIAQVLTAHGVGSASFLQEALHPDAAFLNASILADKPRTASLEGYLFPETYDIATTDTGKDFAKYMVQLLDRRFTPQMRAAGRREGFSVFQVLTLASIVEREARAPSERPTIAGVYINRLHRGMSLGADPTVQYIIGTQADWWPQLRDLARNIHPESRYNTYIFVGLPPGPIANPGLASINAVLYPQRSNFLYFVAIHKTGRHAFAETLAQQIQNQAKYQP